MAKNKKKSENNNIIDAIYNLVQHPVLNITPHYSGKNRANNAGDALEEYIKDLFAGTFNMSEDEREKRQKQVFSYLGNNNNPPDAMLKGGDAIEVKKIESANSPLQFNSSYPKQILSRDNPMISKKCRDAESWDEKDMIYAVGVVKNDKLKCLAMVYGRDYCANEGYYTRIRDTIERGVKSIPDVDFAPSKELGRVNQVDPLGIVSMRVRGMWIIENPWKVFEDVYEMDFSKDFNFMCIINKAKWKTFANRKILKDMAKKTPGFAIENITIKNPDNPASLTNAKLITYSQ